MHWGYAAGISAACAPLPSAPLRLSHGKLEPCSHTVRSVIAELMCASGFADVLSLPVGMAFMRMRQPLKLKRFAALHNAFLFSLSLYMSVECIRQSYRTFRWDRKFQLWCNPNDSGSTFSPDGYRLARVLWIHYLSKVRPHGQWWLRRRLAADTGAVGCGRMMTHGCSAGI